MFKSGNSGSGELNGFLDGGSQIQGELNFEDTFRIDGKIIGKVVSDGSLVVGQKGEVDGEIRVRQVFVSGTVKGEIHATEKIEITAVGRVLADLFAPSLVIEEGAYFEGSCSMSRPYDVEKGKVTQLPLAKKT